MKLGWGVEGRRMANDGKSLGADWLFAFSRRRYQTLLPRLTDSCNQLDLVSHVR